MPTEPDPADGGAPGPAQPDRGPGQDAPAAPRPRRRRPRRATGGTFTGAEPHLPGLDGRAPGTDEETAAVAGERAHEEWLRAQRPPHWG
ncbi:hypothetical protein [Kocuria rhizosphaericola]|uniref:hypothetical protein n=1 Tax=Kocuria rhizosphaericola TaxID=3376284 RepID=UPI0037A7F268